jgi:NEDD8-activating enzyme E1 regulatory subunit
MKAQSDVYIKLQNLYKDKARRDADEVLQTVRRFAGGEDIDPAEVELFCTNARFIKLINSVEGRAPSLAQVVGKQHMLTHHVVTMQTHVANLRRLIACREGTWQ